MKEHMFVSKILDDLVSFCLFLLEEDLIREINAANRKLETQRYLEELNPPESRFLDLSSSP